MRRFTCRTGPHSHHHIAPEILLSILFAAVPEV